MADNATRPIPGSSLSARHHHLSLRDEVDRLFESFFPPAFGRSLFDLDPGSGRAFRALGEIEPGADVKAGCGHYESAADRHDAAGRGTAGESRVARKPGAATERAFDTLRRLFRRPKDADAGAIGTVCDNGMPAVTAPRHDDAGPADQADETTATMPTARGAPPVPASAR